MRWLIVLGILWLPSDAWADVTIIYRKSDRVIAGIVIPPQSVSQELQNVLQSVLGGQPGDYATTSLSEAAWAGRGDKTPVVMPNGSVILEPNAKNESKRAAKASAIQKLKALGLTEEEIDALR